MEIEELKEWLNRNGFEEVDKSGEWEKNVWGKDNYRILIHPESNDFSLIEKIEDEWMWARSALPGFTILKLKKLFVDVHSELGARIISKFSWT